MEGQALDESIEDACRNWVEELLKRSSAPGHPRMSDVAIGSFPGGEGIELVGEDKVALAAEDVVRDGIGDCSLGSLGVVGSGDSFLELLAGGEGESGESFVQQVLHSREVVGHGSKRNVCRFGDLAM